MNGVAFWHRVRTRVDWPLLLTVLAIAAIGITNLYSATRTAPVRGMFEGQVRIMILGLAAFFLASALDYRIWVRWAWLILAVGVALVVGVHFVGNVVKGSRRWIGFGGFAVQPSEFVKVCVILALARYIHDRDTEGMS